MLVSKCISHITADKGNCLIHWWVTRATLLHVPMLFGEIIYPPEFLCVYSMSRQFILHIKTYLNVQTFSVCGFCYNTGIEITAVLVAMMACIVYCLLLVRLYPRWSGPTLPLPLAPPATAGCCAIDLGRRPLFEAGVVLSSCCRHTHQP